jgi:hypothetical protein
LVESSRRSVARVHLGNPETIPLPGQKSDSRVLQMSLGNDQDWGSPESRLLGCRVKDRDLAVVIPGYQTIEVKAEVERHSSKPAGGTRNDRSGGGLKNFVSTEIKADEREKRLARGRAPCGGCL